MVMTSIFIVRMLFGIPMIIILVKTLLEDTHLPVWELF